MQTFPSRRSLVRIQSGAPEDCAMDERACIELANALGVTRHGGWRDLLDLVKAKSSTPLSPGEAYDAVRHALGSRGGQGSMPWVDLIAEVQAVREQAESVKDVTRDLADAMGMVLAAPNDWPVLLDHVRSWRADRESSAGANAELAMVRTLLGLSENATSTDVRSRLQLRLENERGTALAAERTAHATLRQAFDGFRHLIHDALAPVEALVGKDAVSLHLAVRSVVAELQLMKLREPNLVAVVDACGDCGAAVCERCELCHDCSNGECETGRAAEAEPVISALESLTAAIVTDVRDWEANRLDAWIYGVIVGWPPTALDEVASLHGWPDSIKRRLTDLHAAVLAASGYAP